MNPLRAAINYYNMRASWLGDGGQPVPQDQAQFRANICLSCPKNKPHPFYAFLTALAAHELRAQLEMREKMKLKVEGDDDLFICEGCWCVLRLKVFAPLKHLLATTNLEDMHQDNPKCWLLTERDSK